MGRGVIENKPFCFQSDWRNWIGAASSANQVPQIHLKTRQSYARSGEPTGGEGSLAQLPLRISDFVAD